MRATSLKYVPTAILSRQLAGIRGQTLIVNLPGRPKAIRENLEAVFPAIPYRLDLIGAARFETNDAIMKAFRRSPTGAVTATSRSRRPSSPAAPYAVR